MQTHENVSDQLERWFLGDRPRTLGSLIDLFGGKSFAVVFIVLMAVPALPLPTGGVVALDSDSLEFTVQVDFDLTAVRPRHLNLPCGTSFG